VFLYNIGVKKKNRKVINRKGGSCCDICKEPHILVSHHINGRDIPNANHPSNLCNICSNHHAEIHYGNIIVEKWLMTSDGMRLFWHKKGEASFTGEDSTPNLLVK